MRRKPFNIQPVKIYTGFRAIASEQEIRDGIFIFLISFFFGILFWEIIL